MTVFAKDTVYGLESSVKDFQEYIDDNLTWSGTNEVYGLLYPTMRGDNRVLEAYIGTGTKKTEYRQVLVNDKVTSTIGFLEVADRALIDNWVTEIDVIVSVRLDRAFGSNDRNDELAMLQFSKIIKDFYGVGQIKYIKRGIDSVFSGFYTDDIKHRDMHPWLVFSMGIDLQYDYDVCL